MRISVKTCIDTLAKSLKIMILETSKNPHPRKSNISSKYKFVFMTGATVQHLETLTPSLILIFQAGSIGKGLRFF